MSLSTVEETLARPGQRDATHGGEVANEDTGDYAPTQLYRVAFDQVCNQENWKLPIDALVQWDLANLYCQAIEFMGGGKAACESPRYVINRGYICRITAPGYYAATGA